MVAGQIDSVWFSPDSGEFHMVDWKRFEHCLETLCSFSFTCVNAVRSMGDRENANTLVLDDRLICDAASISRSVIVLCMLTEQLRACEVQRCASYARARHQPQCRCKKPLTQSDGAAWGRRGRAPLDFLIDNQFNHYAVHAAHAMCCEARSAASVQGVADLDTRTVVLDLHSEEACEGAVCVHAECGGSRALPVRCSRTCMQHCCGRGMAFN